MTRDCEARYVFCRARFTIALVGDGETITHERLQYKPCQIGERLMSVALNI